MSIVTALQCNFCSKWKSPSEIHIMGESIQICLNCYDHQTKVIEGFIPPEFCQGCMRSTAMLAAQDTRPTFSMFPQFMDGVYQLLCFACNEAYIQKRRDLFRNTRYAVERKLV